MDSAVPVPEEPLVSVAMVAAVVAAVHAGRKASSDRRISGAAPPAWIRARVAMTAGSGLPGLAGERVRDGLDGQPPFGVRAEDAGPAEVRHADAHTPQDGSDGLLELGLGRRRAALRDGVAFPAARSDDAAAAHPAQGVEGGDLADEATEVSQDLGGKGIGKPGGWCHR